MMHPEDANARGIDDGETIRVRSEVGAIELTAEVTETMMPGVVCIPHGFGHHGKGTRVSVADIKAGVSVNDITDHRKIDPITNNAAFSGLSLQVEKINPESSCKVASTATDNG